MAHLNLILDQAADGVTNMSVDEALLEESVQTKNENPVLRFYRFSVPTITVGYGMWRSNNFSLDFSIPVVRRISGGGVVKHSDDLIYALIIPVSLLKPFGKVRESYRVIHAALQNSLESFGIVTQLYEKCDGRGNSYCFDSPVLYDLMMGQKKVAGAGQKRTRGYLLQQGSIAWNILKENSNDFSEALFQKAFAGRLADLFHISVKETLCDVEERKVFSHGYA